MSKEDKFNTAREAWLSERGREEADMFEDAEGKLYIVMEDEGSFGEEYQYKLKKVYLPNELQGDFMPF